MASICNDEQGAFDVMSGHDRNTLHSESALQGQPHINCWQMRWHSFLAPPIF